MAVSLIPAASAVSGTLAVANGGTGTTVLGPAFSAYATNGSQTVSQNTETVVQFSNENFDTASAFNTSTYLFTAPVAGYYQFNVTIGWTSLISAGESYVYIQKNSTGTTNILFDISPSAYYVLSGSTIVQANLNDTFRVIVYQFNGSKALSSSTTFSGCLVRTA